MANAKARKSDGWWSFLSGRHVEVLLLLGMLGCAFALVSLFGFQPSDPTWLAPTGARVENPCGPLGAHLAAFLVWLLGVGAWAIAVPGAIFGVVLAGRPVVSPWRSVGWTTVFVLALTSFDLAFRPEDPTAVETWSPTGGAVGAALADALRGTVGPLGAWIALVGALLVLLTALVRIEWRPLMARVVDGVEARAPAAKAATFKVLGGGARLGGHAIVGGSKWVWKGAVAAAPVGKRGVASVGAAFRKAGDVLAGDAQAGDGLVPEPELGDSELEEEEVPYPEFVRADRAVSTMSADDPEASEIDPAYGNEAENRRGRTMARAAAELAEVEWEPTAYDPTGDATVAAVQGKEEVLDLFPALAPRTRRTETSAGVRGLDPQNPNAPERQPSTPAPPPISEQELPTLAAAGADVPTEEAPKAVEIRREPAQLKPALPAAPVPETAPRPMAHAVVHQNPLLDEKISDDGRALVRPQAEFSVPPLSLLDEVPEQKAVFDENELRALANQVEEKLLSFKIGGQITAIRPGPVVTIFEFLPEDGVKVSRIVGLADDLAMALKALRVRIVAPIPGKGVVGIEIPSPTRLTIYLRELLASNDFRTQNKALPCIIGKDVEGKPVVADIATMPHLLIGGTTGSGKSVGVNGILMSLLFTKTPDQLRLLLIDPKKLEFEMYNNIPHLLYPIVTEPTEANAALSWACREMDNRYDLLARWGVRNIVNYNEKVQRELQDWTSEKARKYAPKDWSETDGPLAMPEKLPYIVIIIDELADLMMVAGKEVEESICRIAQKARACGIHLAVATQRPSVDVVTGLIKANLPTRMSFQLRNRIDSRTILDSMGAEALLGRGDLLYMPPGVGNLMRCHAAFVSDEEVARVTDFLRAQAEPDYVQDVVAMASDDDDDGPVERDALYDAAVRVCVQAGKASTSLVQRHLKVGYNRAANIIEQMERLGVVGPADGARPREVLISGAELDDL